MKVSNNKGETNAEEQPKKTRISQNSVIVKMSDKQADQGDPLSDTKDVPQHLIEGSQLSRAYPAKSENIAKINTDKSDLLDTETFHKLICARFFYSVVVWDTKASAIWASFTKGRFEGKRWKSQDL